MKAFFDMHSDLPTKLYSSNESILHNNQHWSLDKCPADEFVQFFACFIDKNEINEPFKFTVNVINSFKEKAKNNILISKSYKDIIKNKKCGILTIEGGEALEGKISNLQHFYNLGIRLLTLTWNYENGLGYGIAEKEKTKPLKQFGIDVIKKMEQLRMIIDVSHLNEGGFWCVAENIECPFVASHSNSKTICDNDRNLTDEQIQTIIKRKGLIGINLYPPFLSNNKTAKISDILKHIEHILSLGGEDALVFGADFDGVDILPQEIQNVSSLENIIYEMQKNNFSDEIIAKICYKNGKKALKTLLL